jgi:6-pyruvoyltetrahydropterin/6-carboxytetrahydropterin synthase
MLRLAAMAEQRSAPGREARIHVARDTLGFSAAHFGIIGSQRETLHGHNYRVALSASGPIGADGTVLDFAALKRALRDELAELDHRMLVPTACPEVRVERHSDGHVALAYGDQRFLFPAGDVRLLALRNTTCECLAQWLLERVRARLGGAAVRLELSVEETPGQGATVSEEASTAR